MFWCEMEERTICDPPCRILTYLSLLPRMLIHEPLTLTAAAICRSAERNTRLGNNMV